MRKLSDKILMFSIIAAGVLHIKGTYWYETWAVKWFFLCLILVIWLGFKFIHRFSPLLNLCFLYTALSGVAIFATRGNYYMDSALPELLAIKFNASYTTICFVLTMLFLVQMKDKLIVIEKALVWIAALDIPITYLRWKRYNFDEQALGGIFGNQSMNMCFLVVMIPLMFKHFWNSQGKLLLGWPVILYLANLGFLLFASEKIIPFIALGAVTVSFFTARHKRPPVLILIAMLFGGFAYTKHHTNDFTEFHSESINNLTHFRSKVWVWALEWWDYHPEELAPGQKDTPQINKLFGAGLGTTPVLVPRIQAMKNDKEGYFMWFHSEPIQILFELGYLGVILWGLLSIKLFYRSFKTPYLFATICGYAVVLSLNYPFHMAIQALLGGYLIVRTISGEETTRLRIS